MSSRLGCNTKLHCRHRNSGHPNFLVSTGSPALLSAATCSLWEFHGWSAKVPCTCAGLWQSWLNIGTLVDWFILGQSSSENSLTAVQSSANGDAEGLVLAEPPAQPEPSQILGLFCSSWNGKSFQECVLWEHVFLKVMEKEPWNHINRGETRPNLLKAAKEDRAVPCVGLSVASDLNLVVWSLFISHLVGGIISRWYFPFSRWYYKIKTLAIHILCSLFSIFCFVLLRAPGKNMLNNWKQLSLLTL